MDRAINDGILIPWRKNEPEKPKTALQLLTVDKGGLTYQPAIGEYEDIAEIEFASMYPTLMVTRNISPETVLCSCCQMIGRNMPHGSRSPPKRSASLTTPIPQKVGGTPAQTAGCSFQIDRLHLQ